MGGRYGGGEVWEELEGGNRSEYDQNTVCMSIMKFPIYKYEYIRKEYSNREKSISDKGHGFDKESSVWSLVLKGRLTMNVMF